MTLIRKYFKGGRFISALFLITCVFGFFIDSIITLRVSKQVVCEWVVISFVILFFVRNVYLKFFLLWCFIRYLLMFFYPVEIVSTSSARGAYITFNTIFYFSIAYQCLINAKIKSAVILDCICYLCVIQCVVMIIQYYGVWIIIIPKEQCYPGLFGNPNISSSMLALCIPAFLRGKWVFFIPIILYCLSYDFCLGGIIPAVIIIALHLRNKIIYIGMFGATYLCAVLVAIGIMKFPYSAYLRLETWGKVIESMITNHPFIGYGLGQFKIIFPHFNKTIYGYDLSNGIWRHAHNEYIQLCAEIGIIGVMLCISYIIYLVVKSVKNKTSISHICLLGILATLLNSGVNFLFHTTVGIIALIYFAIIEKENRRDTHAEICLFRKNSQFQIRRGI